MINLSIALIFDFHLHFEPSKWTDIAQAIAALIAIPAAIASFIVLFIKDKNKEDQLGELKKIAHTMENRFRATVKPRFWSNGWRLRLGDEWNMGITINNRGGIGFYQNAEIIDGDKNASIYSWGQPISLPEKEGHLLILMKHEKPKEVYFKFKLNFTDSEDYRYEVICTWKEGKGTIDEVISL